MKPLLHMMFFFVFLFFYNAGLETSLFNSLAELLFVNMNTHCENNEHFKVMSGCSRNLLFISLFPVVPNRMTSLIRKKHPMPSLVAVVP